MPVRKILVLEKRIPDSYGKNRPFAVRDHVLRYRIATPYWRSRASTLMISDILEITAVCVRTKNTKDNRRKGIPPLDIQ